MLVSKVDLKKHIKFPKYSEELAEFFGVLTGDGFMNFYPYQHKYLIEIAGDSDLDRDYFSVYLSNLIYTLFNLKPALVKKKNQNTLNLRIISKGIYNFLISAGFKNGLKGNITAPKWIEGDDLFFIKFVRGFFDTDGNITFLKRKLKSPYPKISAVSKSKPLISLINQKLIERGFITNVFVETKKDSRSGKISTVYRITLNGRKNFEKWVDEIGFSNNRHLSKIAKVKTQH